MRNNIKISVAIATYNCEKTIKTAIESIIYQHYDNIKLVVVDELSTDGTTKIIEQYSKIPHKFVIEKDNGVYDAMNKALDVATGDFIIFLGADDHFISNDVVSGIVANIGDLDKVYYGNVVRSGSCDIYCGRFNKYKLAVKNISHQALFYPQCIYKKHKYELTYVNMADYAYNIKIWDTIEFKYIKTLTCYYQSGGLSEKIEDKTFNNDRRSLICSNIGFLPYYYSSIYHFFRNLIKH